LKKHCTAIGGDGELGRRTRKPDTGGKAAFVKPEAVFDELKVLSAKTKAQGWRQSEDKYEISLVHRNERLINLSLATYIAGLAERRGRTDLRRH